MFKEFASSHRHHPFLSVMVFNLTPLKSEEETFDPYSQEIELKSICELPRLKFMFRNGIHNSCLGAFDLGVENTFVHNLNPPHYHCNCGLPSKTA